MNSSLDAYTKDLSADARQEVAEHARVAYQLHRTYGNLLRDTHFHDLLTAKAPDVAAVVKLVGELHICTRQELAQWSQIYLSESRVVDIQTSLPAIVEDLLATPDEEGRTVQKVEEPGLYVHGKWRIYKRWLRQDLKKMLK